ncbi:MAG: hypothetical protein QOF12_1202 [Solirubrobacteraceae bacterium]|jgi:uncharacterized protein YkwD|nr:hypothetical protein [Solirubrobacteraceae bacterium]
MDMRGSRLLPALLAAGALLPASAAGAATCTGVDTPVSAASLSDAKAAVACLVNVERTGRGLPALSPDSRLALAAQRHTDDMVARNFFSHQAPAPAPDGVDPGSRISATGYDWWLWGENIAVGYDTPRLVMIAWMASPDHCTNILAPGATQMGVGAAATPATLGNQIGGTWTQDFGRPSHTEAPSSNTGPQKGCPYQALLPAPASPAPAPTPTATRRAAPQAHPAAAASFVRTGHRLVVRGHVSVPDGTSVRITVRRNHHTIRLVRSHTLHHTFYARIRLSNIRHGYTIHVSYGAKRIARTIS